MIIYCTDLDRTLIYSNKFLSLNNNSEVIKISSDDSYPCFITKESYETLNRLWEMDDKILLIPATTRSTEQFKTLNVFDVSFEYAITCNGARIFHNGIEDRHWKKKIESIIDGYDYYWKSILSKINCQKFIEKETQFVENYFVYGKHNNEKECRRYLEDNIDTELFHWTTQGKKFYIFPKEIRKENALKYIIDKFENPDVIVSGDGEVDLGLFNCATLPSYIIVNSNSNQHLDISKLNLFRTDLLRIIKDKGINSSEEILLNIENLLEKGGEK